MNKNTQISTTVLKGIQTNVEAGAQDGTCQHIVNLRNKHGEWRSVGAKSEVEAAYIETDLVEGDGDYVMKIMLHPALGEMYRIIAKRHEAAGNDTISLYKLNDDLAAWTKTQDIYDVDSEATTFEDMQVFGRWLIVNVNISDGVIYYVLNEGKKEFIRVENPALAYSLLSPTDYSDLQKDVASSNPNTDSREGYMGPYYAALHSAIANDNRGRGGIFARLAFRSNDKDIWVSPVMYTHLGMCKEDDSAFFAANGKVIYNIDAMYASADTGPDPDLWYINRFRFAGLNLIYKFSDVTAIQQMIDNNLSVKMVLYVSRMFDIKDYVLQSFIKRAEGNPTLYNFATSIDQSRVSDTIDTYTANMYELWSISLKDIISHSTTEQTIRLSLKNIQAISADRQLIVEEHTWDRMKGDHILDYNARLHLSNVSRFFNIKHIHPLCRKEDVDLIKTRWLVTEYNPGTETYEWVNIDAFDWDSTSLNAYITLNGIYTIHMYAIILDDSRKFLIEKDITDYATVWHTSLYGSLTLGSYHLFMNPALFLPATNYTELYITMKRVIDGEERLLYSSFKEKLSLNKAISTPDVYFSVDFTYEIGGLNTLKPPRVTLPITGGVIQFTTIPLFATYIANIAQGHAIDTNRLQVSSQENPLLLPARNSYRIGTVSNRLIAAMPAAQTMSEGQFGQFPIYVFTSIGIYALEQGDSNALYSNIRPLNQEIAINKNLIIAAQGAVFFVTRQGMKAMQGSEVNWIGQALDGPFASLLDSSIYFEKIITDNWLTNIEQVVISNNTFADQLESSQIAYDHQEEEIIIQVAAKQFVYCMKTGVWVERSDNYRFLYPAWPGYEFAKIVDMQVQGICIRLYNPHQEKAGEAVPIYVESNRIVTDYKAIKAFSNILVNCNLHILDNKRVGLYIFGSEDDDVYKLLAGREEIGHKRRMKINHIPAGLRSIIIILSGTVDQLSTINEIITEFVPRYQGKIR